jgi:1-acyl-sn-glycerol-3-phosphate acyltransferase
MIVLRSSVFTVLAVLFTAFFSTLGVLFCWAPPMVRHRLVTTWVPAMMWAARHVLGIRYRVIGRENIPLGPAVILSKHQSAWETIALQEIFPPLCYVLKRELLWIPFLGWGLAVLPTIAINRSAGQNALSQVVEKGRDRLARGLWVAVFPEGTRMSPGESGRYKPGGAILARRAGVPVVPVAHNAGEFWPKNAFLKRPGEIVVSIGPVIEVKGVKTDELNTRAGEWIENEMRRLFPRHYEGGEKQAEETTAADAADAACTDANTASRVMV